MICYEGLGMNKSIGDYLQELTKNEIICLSNKDYCKKKELKTIKVKRGCVVPPQKEVKEDFRNRLVTPWLHAGVLDANNEYVELSSQKAYGMRDRVDGPCTLVDDEIPYIDEEVIYMNVFIRQWGHFLIDVIGRLWYVINNDVDLRIVYTCMDENDELSGNYIQLLNLIGISTDRMICIKKPTRFRSVIVPESSIFPGLYYTEEWKTIFDTVVNNVKIDTFGENDIFCSRRLLKKSNEEGEEQIEYIFNENGYESVYLEKMTVADQIRVLNSARRIVMINGSLAHNLLFVKNNASVSIINKTYRLNLHQFLINEVASADVTYIDAYCSPMPILYGSGPFIIQISEEFLKFCRDNSIRYNDQLIGKRTISFFYYIKWAWIYRRFIIKGVPIKETTMKDYEKQFKEIRKYYRRQTKRMLKI